MVQVYS